MDHECYSFKLMCPPVKVHIVMLGTAEQTGQMLIHYTLLSVQITLPEHNRRLSVCVAWPLWNKTESSGWKWSGRVERREAETVSVDLKSSLRSFRLWHITNHSSNTTEQLANRSASWDFDTSPLSVGHQMPSDQQLTTCTHL